MNVAVSPGVLAERDIRFMRNALAIGERHLGLAWPNPSVGAVVVQETGAGPRIVARGITQPGGRPHAERVAIEAAGAAARGATLYVTLEPCSHHGKSPPCVDAVMAAGIARVVVALTDPDSRVSGRGAAMLRAAGVAVVEGVLADEAARAHRGHVKRVSRGLPAVTLKLARTADGFAAAASGPRLLVTGDAANARVHLMRAHADAILVGLGTVLADDPLLTVRLPGLERRSPLRVLVDARLATTPDARIFAGPGSTWVIAGADAPVEAERRIAARGAEVLRTAVDGAGRVRMEDALRLLAARGVTRLFCEGGPRLADALAAADLVDEVALFTGARPLGGDGLPAVGPRLADLMGRLRPLARETLGPDLLETFERTD